MILILTVCIGSLIMSEIVRTNTEGTYAQSATIITSIILMLIIISIIVIGPINYIVETSNMNHFIATSNFINDLRTTPNSCLSTRLQQEIITQNHWLYQAKHMNKTILDIFIPDQIENLKPIK